MQKHFWSTMYQIIRFFLCYKLQFRNYKLCSSFDQSVRILFFCFRSISWHKTVGRSENLWGQAVIAYEFVIWMWRFWFCSRWILDVGPRGLFPPSTPLFRRLFDIGSCVGVCKMHVVVEPKRFIVQIGQIFCSLSPGVLKGYVVCITYAIYAVGWFRYGWIVLR